MRKMTYLLVFGMVILFSFENCQNDNPEIEKDREEVILRKIGHEILLLSNDSTSLVRPIIYENDKYRIQFESNFSILPDILIKTIDTIIQTSLPYDNYLVQVEECKSKEIVYSYEIEAFPPISDGIACGTRELPNGCYEVIIEFILPPEQHTASIFLIILIAIIILVIGRFYIYKKHQQPVNIGKIKIGAYLYDPKRMTLTLVNNSIELTSKESELLNLLYESVNDTVDRETILNKVWGDEGDYVGRTLDVYVSKLRKKLEQDSTIEIKNLRGIGYKLILEV